MGKSRKLIKGVNDLATVRPNLVNEWDYDKNERRIDEYTYGSRQFVYWKCKYGHRWKAMIYERYRGTGCPVCNGKFNTSYPEQLLYACIKQIYPNTISRGKYQGYEFDIAIPELRLCIEYSGEHWEHKLRQEKMTICKEHNVKFIEIIETKKLNNEIKEIDEYTYIYGSYNHREEYLLNILSKIINIDITSIDLEKAKMDAISNSRYSIPDESQLYNNELLRNEWSSKNIASPKDYSMHSGFKVWWKCSKCNYEWEAKISDRSRGQGCPACKANKMLQRNLEYINKQIKQGNNLANFDRKLSDEWDYDKNDIRPENVTPGSNKKVWWKCSKCGHSWQAMIYSRAKLGRGCPECWRYRNKHKKEDINNI